MLDDLPRTVFRKLPFLHWHKQHEQVQQSGQRDRFVVLPINIFTAGQ
jgi:hypothetical protein